MVFKNNCPNVNQTPQVAHRIKTKACKNNTKLTLFLKFFALWAKITILAKVGEVLKKSSKNLLDFHHNINNNTN